MLKLGENELQKSISTLIDAGLLRESEDGGFELGRAAKLANDGSLAAQFQKILAPVAQFSADRKRGAEPRKG